MDKERKNKNTDALMISAVSGGMSTNWTACVLGFHPVCFGLGNVACKMNRLKLSVRLRSGGWRASESMKQTASQYFLSITKGSVIIEK